MAARPSELSSAAQQNVPQVTPSRRFVWDHLGATVSFRVISPSVFMIFDISLSRTFGAAQFGWARLSCGIVLSILNGS